METAFVVALVPFEALDTDAETAGFGFFIFYFIFEPAGPLRRLLVLFEALDKEAQTFCYRFMTLNPKLNPETKGPDSRSCCYIYMTLNPKLNPEA
jgi:hypothetical protein